MKTNPFSDCREAVLRALRDEGFAELPVPAASVLRVTEACQRFFQRPRNEKLAYAHGFTGYVPYGEEHSGDLQQPDMIESYTLSSLRLEELTPPEMQIIREEFFLPAVDLCAALCRELVSLLSGQADREPPFEYWIQVNYFAPVCDMPQSAKGGMRMGAHLDPGFITLFPAGISREFQYCNRQGEWREPAPSGQMIVFTGELFGHLTDGAIPGCLHRVRMPADSTKPRLSFALTATPRTDGEIAGFPQFYAGRVPPRINGRSYMEKHLTDVMASTRYQEL